MSAVNGDKSRFNRERKQKIAKRMRARELMKTAAVPAKPKNHAAAVKPGAVSA
jgi:hypothetical protein